MLRSMNHRLYAVAIAYGVGTLAIWITMTVLTALRSGSGDATIVDTTEILLLYGVLYLLIIMLIGNIIIGVCLVVSTPPIWWVLHKTGLTHPLFFILAGTLVAFAAGTLMEPLTFSQMPLSGAIAGAVTGATIRHFGYERP